MNGIKEELERKRRALSEALQFSMDLTRGGSHHHETNKDPYGSASATHDDEIAADVAARRARELKEVERAIADVDAGRYGVCQDCGGEIAPARLKALPLATRCVTCQARLETARAA
jgi:DnaK suppressor protein